MWKYEILTGNLYDSDGELIGKGYSGHPPHVNDPDAVHIHNVGPIPPGLYSMVEPRDTEHGPYTIPLIPHDHNEMFGRDGFLVHGDKIDAPGKQLASLGCIIQSRDVREKVWDSGDHILKVISGLITNKGATQ